MHLTHVILKKSLKIISVLWLVQALTHCQILYPTLKPTLNSPTNTPTNAPTNSTSTEDIKTNTDITQPRQENFSIKGKLGITTPKQTASAFYAWIWKDGYYAIELSGALGVGFTQIQGTPTRVTLDNAETGHLESDSAEQLLEEATGWKAPLSALPAWIMGKQSISPDKPILPASNHTQLIVKDHLNRLAMLHEQGFRVEFFYLNDELNTTLPNKLIMKPLIENTDQASLNSRVVLTIQSRE